MDLQYIKTLWGNTLDKMAKFDYRRLIPKGRVDRFTYGTAGIAITWPWRKEGLGIGLGLGVWDVWAGWPRHQENLHYDGCLHSAVKEVPVDTPV
jgi:hypothetical protein